MAGKEETREELQKERNHLRRQLSESELTVRDLKNVQRLTEGIINTLRDPLLILDARLSR